MDTFKEGDKVIICDLLGYKALPAYISSLTKTLYIVNSLQGPIVTTYMGRFKRSNNTFNGKGDLILKAYDEGILGQVQANLQYRTRLLAKLNRINLTSLPIDVLERGIDILTEK